MLNSYLQKNFHTLLVTLISDACATKDLEWNGRKLPASLINDVYMASLNGKFATVMSSTDYLL